MKRWTNYIAVATLLTILSGFVMPFAGAWEIKQIGLAVFNYHDYSEPGAVDDFARESSDATLDRSDPLVELESQQRSSDELLLDDLIVDLLANENELTEEEFLLLFELLGP